MRYIKLKRNRVMKGNSPLPFSNSKQKLIGKMLLYTIIFIHINVSTIAQTISL